MKKVKYIIVSVLLGICGTAYAQYDDYDYYHNQSSYSSSSYHSYSGYDEEDMGDDDYNRFQIGYQAGLKLLFGQCFSIGAAYKGDLTPFYSDGDISERFRGVAFQIGYCF